MILADTSVWADHLRKPDPMMSACLDIAEIVPHPFVLGELAMGSMPRYDAVMESLQKLPRVDAARPSEVLVMIRQHRLMGVGIGYIDAHILASVRLTPDTQLWTREKRLRQVALQMGVASALT